MNIIKLKDIVHPTDQRFNEKLKGRYAWWVRLRWIIPFDEMTDEQYAQAEQIPDNTLANQAREGNWYYIFNIIDYVDDEATNCANDISGFKVFNKFTPDSDITTDELKKFRTWLAESLLGLEPTDEDEKIMLKYYANGMSDDALVSISSVSQWSTIRMNIQNASCCACSTINLDSQYDFSGSSCDSATDIYKMGMHNKMVEIFSNLNYWISKPKELLVEFQHYIDNLLRINMIPTTNTIDYSKYMDCSCTTTINTNDQLLKDLSIALGYIINCQISGNKNFIMDTLYNWSSNLYELMEWN